MLDQDQKGPNSPKSVAPAWRWHLGPGLLILLGVVRIILAYPANSQMIDESSHIATGIEWLDQGTYTLNPENPPLARVLFALGPYLSGAVKGDTLEERVQVLHGEAPYPRTLYLARAGNLVFFIAASVLIWAWATTVFDRPIGLLAVALFTQTPFVLAHAGVVTTDMAAAASVAGALLAFTLWTVRPSRGRSILFGVALGFTCLFKFTSILFLGASGVALVLSRMLLALREGRFPVSILWRNYLGPAILSVGIMCVMIWAGYRFSFGSMLDPADRPHPEVESILGKSGALRDLAYKAMETPIPAPEFFLGLGQMLAHSRIDRPTYLLGEVRESGGFLAFFPVAFLFKTPIPFILFSALGGILMVIKYWTDGAWMRAVPLFGAIAMVLVVMPSGMNIGLRHVLPIFCMLSLVAADGVCAVVRSSFWNHRAVRWAVIGLGGWFLFSSVSSHPHYIPYFNFLAGSHPEQILADSDLDWGQDVGRLSHELAERGIEQVHLGLFTRAKLDHFDWPAHTTQLEETGPAATGWIAASIFRIKITREFAWLEAYHPTATIGDSIRLYFIPPHDGEKPFTEAEKQTGDANK